MNYTGGEHGVMGAILSMTAPPSFGNHDSNNKGKGQDKSGGGQKKNNRATAKELYCEGCGDTGDVMLVCTMCSVSYHPVCDDPPLDDELVKDLDWQCRSCRNKKANCCMTRETAKRKDTSEEDERFEGFTGSLDQMDTRSGSRTSSGNSNGNTANYELTDESDKELHSENKSKMEDQNDIEIPLDQVQKPTTRKKKVATRRKKVNVSGANKIKNVFSSVIANAKSLNPTLFEIPISFQLNQYQFPGTSRSLVRKPGGVKLKPTIVDLENFTVPKPLTLCHHCGRSCRTAPLLKCDYCPKYFHFDCLNPPLTSPPVGLWMCPLHPEPFLESRKLTSTQLSQRVRLWDMTHKQIDRNSVVLSFLKKCTRKNPLFGRKIKVPGLAPHEVLDGDGNFLLPTTNTDSSLNAALTQNVDESSHNTVKPETMDVEDEIKKKLFQCYEDVKFPEENSENGDAMEEDNESNLKTEQDNETNIDLSSTTNSEPKENEDGEKPKAAAGENLSGLDLLFEAANKALTDEERRSKFLKELSVEQVYELAAQRLEDIDIRCKDNLQLVKVQPATAQQQTISSNLPLDSSVQKSMMAKYTIQFYCLNVKKVLKFSSSSIVIGTDNSDDPTCSVFNPQIFVNCKRVSGCHAVIFFDRCHNQWEILNYSPHGIIVDSVLYTIKAFEEKEEEPPNDLETMKAAILTRRKIAVKSMLNPRLLSMPGFFPNGDLSCSCEEDELSTAMKIKNEGSAILCVGSEIQIGCLKLVVKRIDTEEEEVVASSSL